MNNEIIISECLNKTGVKACDTVMIHGDAGVAAQFSKIDKNKKINHLIAKILEFFSDGGTVVVPTFSYSFIKKEDFDREKTPSVVGQFSEYFRIFPNVLRSNNPNFSVAAFGRNARAFTYSRIDDAFGKNTAFDLIKKMNGKIICLGCVFNAVTFVHHVEQNFGVPYRYFKKFSGTLCEGGVKKNLLTTYYVRDLSINSEIDLKLLQDTLLKRDQLYLGEIGRLPLLVTDASNLFETATELLKKDTYALIKETRKAH